MGKEFSYWFPIYGGGNSFIYLLFAIMLMLSLICFIYSKYDLLYPPFVGTASFTCCIGLAAIYTDFWDLPMHFNTTVTVICMVVMFIVGGLLATQTIIKDKLKRASLYSNEKVSESIGISMKLYLVVTLLLMFCLYENYNEFINLASNVTNSTKISEMLFPVTKGIAKGIIKFSKAFTYRALVAKSISYSSIIFFWYNFMDKKYSNCFKWGLLALFYLPFILLTGGRQPFLYFILFSLVSCILVLRKKLFFNNRKNEAFIVICGLLGFFLFFLGIGLLNGKIDLNLGLFRVLVHYAGINISAFDVFINEMTIPDTPYIGVMTLSPINAVINHFGLNLPVDSAYVPVFTVFGNTSTNVYTSLMKYIIDYGFLGCGIIMFLLGFFYTLFYEFILAKQYKSWMIMLYAFISYPIFLLGREERFFNEILASRTVYAFIVMIFFYRLALSVYKKRRS